MLGVFAEFETNLRRERQFEGIAKGRRRVQGGPSLHFMHMGGVYRGAGAWRFGDIEGNTASHR
jgi:hypothetical protein